LLKKLTVMKIIHFIASIDKKDGGTTAYMQLLANTLKTEVDLSIVTGQSPTPIQLSGVRISFFNPSLISWFVTLKFFSTLLKIEKPDLVHINGIWTPQNYLFQKEAQKLGIKVVLSPHGMLAPYILQRHPLKKKVALALYQNKAILNADYLHATAVSEKTNIRNLGYSQEITIVPNGIDINQILEKRRYRSDTIKMLFLSRLHPVKGIELLIEAISLLNRNDIMVQIVGEGEDSYINSLKELSKEKGVATTIEFTGGVYGTKKWELYREADLFVLPTHSENFGIVIAEALATGLPVITTKGTPWKELETRNCGWWIDLSVDNLAQSISEALNKTASELKTMGENGKALVKEKYDIKAVASKMVSFYKTIIEQ
jgi:glycosyltransferase involved in cell wall biosynthesis